MEHSSTTISNATTTASNGATGIPAAPHRKNAAQRNRGDSPYQGRTAQKDNPTQLIIKQAVDFLIQQVEAGKSETLTAYLSAMARFHNYSFGNIVAIARQRPTATRVAGFGTWKEMGRFVKRGEKGILLPVRNLQFWIESNILLILKDAPFDKRDAQLVPAAGSCVDCPKRTGHNKLLFSELGKQDSCSDPNCYQSKVSAHLAKTIAAKPQIVQISTAYGAQREGSATLPRNKYTAIRDDKPKSKEEAQRPEFKVCKFATEAIITEGSEVGTVHTVCANPACPVHHPKKQHQRSGADASFKAEQEKQRKETAIANATGIRVLAAIAAAVPVRLMKRDLLFVVERLASLLDDNRLAIVAKQQGIKKVKDSDSIGKLFAAFLRRAEESVLGRVLVELTILHAASRQNAAQVLHEAAAAYKVDTDAITLKVKQEFAAKEKTQAAKKAVAKAPSKAVKKTKAA